MPSLSCIFKINSMQKTLQVSHTDISISHNNICNLYFADSINLISELLAPVHRCQQIEIQDYSEQLNVNITMNNGPV